VLVPSMPSLPSLAEVAAYAAAAAGAGPPASDDIDALADRLVRTGTLHEVTPEFLGTLVAAGG